MPAVISRSCDGESFIVMSGAFQCPEQKVSQAVQPPRCFKSWHPPDVLHTPFLWCEIRSWEGFPGGCPSMCMGPARSAARVHRHRACCRPTHMPTATKPPACKPRSHRQEYSPCVTSTLRSSCAPVSAGPDCRGEIPILVQQSYFHTLTIQQQIRHHQLQSLTAPQPQLRITRFLYQIEV